MESELVLRCFKVQQLVVLLWVRKYITSNQYYYEMISTETFEVEVLEISFEGSFSL